MSSMRLSCLRSASFAVDITWFFSSSEFSISCILTAVDRKRWRRARLLSSKTLDAVEPFAENSGRALP